MWGFWIGLAGLVVFGGLLAHSYIEEWAEGLASRDELNREDADE